MKIRAMARCLGVVVLAWAGWFCGAAGAANAVATNVVAKQRYPWNGLVDIACTVEGYEKGTATLAFQVEAVDGDTGAVTKASHVRALRDGEESDNLDVEGNGEYRLVWDAAADLGQVRCTNMAVRVTFASHEMVQLWEGGPRWAKTNIGAEEPWEYGLYFWWGDTVGYRWEYETETWVASDGSGSHDSLFDWNDENVQTYEKPLDGLASEGWITADRVLTPAHDAARAHWGGKWRMPTDAEYQALIDNCDWSWTWSGENGVAGSEFRGRGDFADKSIFFPAAGQACGGLAYDGGFCYYWTSVPYWDEPHYDWHDGDARDVFFDCNVPTSYNDPRFCGNSVRAVWGGDE